MASEQSLRQAALPWPAKLHARPRIAYNWNWLGAGSAPGRCGLV